MLLVSGVSLGDIHFFRDVISFADDGDDDDHEDQENGNIDEY